MQNRLKSLDILRAVAIFLVMGVHLKKCPESYGFLHHLMRRVDLGAWVGVDLFFVLSGFLISGLLFKEHRQSGGISIKHFFIRRGFKIYPAFYVMMLTTYFVFILRNGISFYDLKPWFLFFQDYFLPYRDVAGHYWLHTWSLAVEEKFYFFLPILLIFVSWASKLKERPFKLVPIIFIAIALTCLGLRVWTSLYVNAYHYTILRFPFHLRLDALFFGVFLSYFYHYHPTQFREIARRFKFLLLLGGVVLIAPVFQIASNQLFMHTLGFTFVYLGSGLILVALLEHPFKPTGFAKAIASIGTYSYSIYLWNLPVKAGIEELFERLHYSNWALYAVICLSGSILIGILMAKLVEYPALNFRDRFYPASKKL